MFKGAFTALVTPFSDGQIDTQALRDHVDFQIEKEAESSIGRIQYRREIGSEGSTNKSQKYD